MDDPIPTLVIEAWMRSVMTNTLPCSGCNASLEKLKKGAERIHFHASDVGACGRRTQYSMQFPLKAMTGTDPWFLKDGHFHEEVILRLIREGSADPKALDESIESISIYAAKNEEELFSRIPYKDSRGALKEFVIVGHWDGLLSVGYVDGRFEEYLLECKSVKDTTFSKVKAGEISNEWYGQIQTYLHQLGLKAAYLLVKNRTTAEVLPPIRIDFDPKYLKKRRQVLAEVHEAVTSGGLVPREHETRNNDECFFCKFKTKCWGLDPSKEKNNVSEKNVGVRRQSPEDNRQKRRKVKKGSVRVRMRR